MPEKRKPVTFPADTAAPLVMTRTAGEKIQLYAPTHHLYAEISNDRKFIFEAREISLEEFTDFSLYAGDTRVRMYRHAFLKAHPPFSHINIELTRRCRLHCPHCFVDDKKCGKELSRKKINTFIEKMTPLEISLTGGEIFLRDDLAAIIGDIVETTAGNAHLRLLATGAWYQDREKAKTRAREISAITGRRVEFRFTLFDFRAPWHDLLCGCAGNFDALKDLTAFMKTEEIPFSRNLVLTSYNVERRFDAIKALEPESVSSIVYPSHHGERAARDISISPEQFRRLLSEDAFRSLAAQYIDPAGQCRYHCNFPLLDSGGDIFPCNLPGLSPLTDTESELTSEANSLCRKCPAVNLCKKCPSSVPAFAGHYCPFARIAADTVTGAINIAQEQGYSLFIEQGIMALSEK